MAQPRIAFEEGMLIHEFPIHADAISASTVIEVGDLLRYESDGTAIASGVGLFDTATEDEKFMGFSKGKTNTSMSSGAYGDKIPVCMRGVIEIDLTSASYNFGEPLGWASKNTLVTGALSSEPTIAWFYGSDEDTITRGLVWIDITALRVVFDLAT